MTENLINLMMICIDILKLSVVETCLNHHLFDKATDIGTGISISGQKGIAYQQIR